MLRTSFLFSFYNYYKYLSKKCFTNSGPIQNTEQELVPVSPTSRTGQKEAQAWQTSAEEKKGKRKTSKQAQPDTYGDCQDSLGEGKNQYNRITRNPRKFSSLQGSKMCNLEAIFRPCVAVTRHGVSYFCLGLFCTQVMFSQYANAPVAKMIKISCQTVKSTYELLLVSEKGNC